MYVANNYPVGSCEYTATREHENKHYEAFSNILRVYQEYLREMITSQERSLPTEKRPAYAAAFDAGVAPVDAVIERQFRDVITTMIDQITEETALLEQETPTVRAKCSSW